jgi:tRNA A37 threonylcarbamoyladenosine modification protein TsaB
MYKILIDSTDRFHKSIKLVKERSTDAVNSSELIDEIEGDVDIVVAIKDLLVRNNITAIDITEFVPNLGPGSFTGLKSGITIANIFNWALGKKKSHDFYLPEYGREPNIHSNNIDTILNAEN